MSDALTGQVLCSRELAPRWLRKPKEEMEQPATNICRISVAAFCLNLKKKENICFATSILEIDHKLKACTPNQPDSDPPEARHPDETEL